MSTDSKSALVRDIRADLALDMSEERWASGLGSSVAIQRRTLAFEFDKDAFFLYDFRLHDSGRHRDLVSGEVTQDFIRDNLFNSQITPADIKKMERRSLVPEQFWTQAYTRDSDKTIVLGGEQGSAFKSDESLRISSSSQEVSTHRACACRLLPRTQTAGICFVQCWAWWNYAY